MEGSKPDSVLCVRWLGEHIKQCCVCDEFLFHMQLLPSKDGCSLREPDLPHGREGGRGQPPPSLSALCEGGDLPLGEPHGVRESWVTAAGHGRSLSQLRPQHLPHVGQYMGCALEEAHWSHPLASRKLRLPQTVPGAPSHLQFDNVKHFWTGFLSSLWYILICPLQTSDK